VYLLLRIFERRIMSTIYGPTCENGVWRIKYSDELYSLCKDTDTVRVIKLARIRWLGHLEWGKTHLAKK
jgi:saccharopine dehydrogenase-like NADP-dependent oxidoreductase